ncbi:capsid assembly protein [Brevundimonas diminuta]|uniref:capsid assembly protein n=1 Tax=Brevundimonas diminuta TaxID=293 RepID=UPI001F5A5F6F|nr:hypothetical protein [Brevundimonas diminuta]
MTTETPAIEAENIDLPASALPEGVTADEYRASLDKTEATTETAKAARPAHIPEKFWDADKGEIKTDDLVKSYAELEQKFSGAKKDDDKPLDLKIEKADGEAQAEANPITTAFEAFAQTYAETNGAPGEDAIAKIEKLGVPKTIIQTYMDGLAALGREQSASIFAAAGDEQTLDAAMAWGENCLSDEDRAAYNALVDNPATQRQGVEWLVGRFKAAQPNEGNFVQGQSGAATGDVFRSRAEMINAMKSDKYQTDTAYQREVAEKAERSIANW